MANYFSTLEAKANGNVFGVALAQCVLDDDSRIQDDINPTSPTASNATTPVAAAANVIDRKDSAEFGLRSADKRTSPSGSISSTNDSGYSVSPASPSSLHVIKKIDKKIFSLIY